MSREIPGACPEPDELGRAGWTILHTAAAVFPNKPTPSQQEGMRKFIEGWSQVYACSHCAYHMRQHVAKHPPLVKDKREASWYICDMHNKVNKILDKEQFDCSPEVVLKRWHPTYPEMEDTPTIEQQIEDIKREEASKKIKQQSQQPSASVSASSPSAPKSGGFFSSWFGGGKKAEVVPVADPFPPQSTTPAVTPQQQHQVIGGRQVPLGGLSRIPEHELDVDPKTHSRWGDKPVIDQTEKGMGAVRSGWNTSDSQPNAYAYNAGQRYSLPPSNGLAEAAATTTTTPQTASTNETDIAEIMKKVRACAVYCPEKDKNKVGLGH